MGPLVPRLQVGVLYPTLMRDENGALLECQLAGKNVSALKKPPSVPLLFTVNPKRTSLVFIALVRGENLAGTVGVTGLSLP
jgi:hypothetical protein